MDRRGLLKSGLRGGCLATLGLVAGSAAHKNKKVDMLWQIDPYTCVSCGNCATYCVLKNLLSR